MNVNTMLQFRVHDLRIHLHEIFCEVSMITGSSAEESKKRDELVGRFDRIDRIVSLYLSGIYEGWSDFDWKKAKELGWLSRNDEEMFKEFLT